MPASISDADLEKVAQFRSARRIPAVVWRHTGNGAVLARCSQPEVGFLCWRSQQDEELVKAMADSCAFDRGTNRRHPSCNSSSSVGSNCSSVTSSSVGSGLMPGTGPGGPAPTCAEAGSDKAQRGLQTSGANQNGHQVTAAASSSPQSGSSSTSAPDLAPGGGKKNLAQTNHGQQSPNLLAETGLSSPSSEGLIEDKNNSSASSNGSLRRSGIPSLKDLSAEAAQSKEVKKVVIVDARSYTAAQGNRARGGGSEFPEYYSYAEIHFMNLANIHSIRKGFQNLRGLLNSPIDQGGSWFHNLDGTKWLQYLSLLLKAAVKVVTAIEVEARPVIVHCSDGWDRTPQIVALSELMMDPYYR